MSKKLSKSNWPRPLIQWSIILTIVVIALIPKFNENFVPDFEAYCPFGGIQALGSYLLNQALSCTMTSAQIVMGIALMLAVFVFSKLFCAFICPVGTVSEWLGKLGDKLKVRITIKGIADKALRALKYILLFITLYYTLQSNELFCKKFDPYFATASGFSMDVVVLYAVITIVVVVLGSVFIRLFWCKYICPLGAISNIFKFTGFFVLVLVGYIILLKVGVTVSYVYPLAIACIGGYILELTGFARKMFPVFKITRNEESCIDCQLCSRKCPQAIDVATLKVVREADCNLCGECMSVCPVKNTLQINKNKSLRWIAPVATIVLILAGVIVGSMWEVPTIDQKWGSEAEIAQAKIYTQSGLKSIKCYGSSMAFASKMQQVPGVLGVATYVKHHRVKVYYNPAKLPLNKLQEQIFTPSKSGLKMLRDGVTEVKEVTVWLNNFFDAFDFSYLSRLLLDKTNAVGVLSEYDCPVLVRIYFSGDQNIDEKALVDILESKSLTFTVAEQSKTVELNYEVAKGPEVKVISAADFSMKMFKPFNYQFNNGKAYAPSVIKKVDVLLDSENKENLMKLTYFVSHMSNYDRGIVAVESKLDSLYRERLIVSYVDTMITEPEVVKAMTMDTLTYSLRGGVKKKMLNVFHFQTDTDKKAE